MKSKKIIIVALVLGLVLSLAGGVILIINSFKSEKESIAKAKEEIVSDYAIFKTKIENFSTLRGEIYSEVLSSQYYGEIFNNYTTNIEKLTKYETAVKEIDDVSVSLKKNCINKVYNDKDVKNKCDAFLINYEQSINYFVSDVERFNSRIDEYNKWRTTENTDKKYTELEKYNSKYKEYVDIDGDKVESGKAEK